MESSKFLYYGSAIIAIVGTVGYHSLLKKIPETMSPVVSIIGIYIGVIIIGIIVAPFIINKDVIKESIHQLSWIQLGIAFCIVLVELGFLLMYRHGWDLSTGNIVTGVAINVGLLLMGVFLLKENLSNWNIVGVVISIIGVGLISI